MRTFFSIIFLLSIFVSCNSENKTTDLPTSEEFNKNSSVKAPEKKMPNIFISELNEVNLIIINKDKKRKTFDLFDYQNQKKFSKFLFEAPETTEIKNLLLDVRYNILKKFTQVFNYSKINVALTLSHPNTKDDLFIQEITVSEKEINVHNITLFMNALKKGYKVKLKLLSFISSKKNASSPQFHSPSQEVIKTPLPELSGFNQLRVKKSSQISNKNGKLHLLIKSAKNHTFAQTGFNRNKAIISVSEKKQTLLFGLNENQKIDLKLSNRFSKFNFQDILSSSDELYLSDKKDQIFLVLDLENLFNSDFNVSLSVKKGATLSVNKTVKVSRFVDDGEGFGRHTRRHRVDTVKTNVSLNGKRVKKWSFQNFQTFDVSYQIIR